MRIHSFSKVLGLPLALMAVAIAYTNYSFEGNISAWIFFPVVLLVTVYVFHGPLDHWWLSMYPIPLDDRLKDWLQNYFPYYKTLNDQDRNIFEYRMILYLDGRLFKSVGSEQRDVPEDIKCMVAAHGLFMTLHQKDYLIGDIDRVFLYKHPFPSPRHPYLHNVETDTEDGVIILSLEQLTNAVLHPNKYFNIAYYAYAECIVAVHKSTHFPEMAQDTWPIIERISGMTQDSITKQIGLNEVHFLAIHITMYFVFRDKYQVELPENFVLFERIFTSSSI